MTDITQLSDVELRQLADLAARQEPIRGLSDAELQRRYAQSRVATDTITTGSKNFAKDMPFTQQFAAGYGQAVPNLIRGIGHIAGVTPQSEIDESKRLDQPLLSTPGGVAGNIVGNAALYAPTAAVPGAGSLPGAAAIGAATGAVQPVATGDSRLLNTGVGAAAGAGGQLLGRVLGRIIRPVQPSLNPQEEQLAQAAAREGIPLTAGQRTGSKPLQIAESVMENLPLTSGPQLAKREAQQRAFTAAVLKKGGMIGDVADAGTLLSQKQGLGGQMANIANASNLDFNRGLTTDLANIVGDADSHLPPDAARRVASVVDKVLSQVDQNGNMAGTNYQGWREPLRAMAQDGTAEGRYMGQIRKALDSAFASQAGPDYQGLSRQYANTKTIIDAMGGPGKLPATGQVPPAQLGAALARSVGKENKALGVGDLNDLSRIGQTFLKGQIPDSGTAQRQLIQSLITTGGGSLVGGAAAAGTGHDPVQGAFYGAAAGAGAAAVPRALQMIINSPAGQAYLTRGVIPIDATTRAALSKALQLMGTAAVPALTQ